MYNLVAIVATFLYMICAAVLMCLGVVYYTTFNRGGEGILYFVMGLVFIGLANAVVHTMNREKP